MALFGRKCPCLRPQIEEDVRTLDYRHCSLQDVPSEVFNYERTLEELLVDSNQIVDLPRELFYCHGLRKLSISDNEIKQIPSAIGSLISLEQLDLSKNGESALHIIGRDGLSKCKISFKLNLTLCWGYSFELSLQDNSNEYPQHRVDKEIKQIPSVIGSLISLEQLDLSKNGVIDIPENIKCCKYLKIVDASVNPLGKLPEGFTQLLNLTQLNLNDTFLDYLPGNFGRLSKLKILEVRENHLKTLPKSFSRLVELEKLDIGHNEFMELPDVIGSLSSLLELWCDHNQITSITPTIGNLKQLMFFDGCKNNLQSLPAEIEGCSSLADLHLTTNQLQSLPDSIGNLTNLTTLKVDDNCLTTVPNSIGGLESLSELNVSANVLKTLPASLGLLRYLRTLYGDDNILEYIPAELGSCSGITVLSLRGNKLSYIPDELGRIPRLRVLNLSSNKLSFLPFTMVKCKELQALWLSENQTRPLVPLQSEHHRETGQKILTCYLLPQGPPQDSGEGGDTDSFHASMWEEERRNRQQIHFEFGDDSDVDGNLIRQPTPYPKEMREKARHLKNLALRQQISNGQPVTGEDNQAFEERRSSKMSPSMERLTITNSDEGYDVRDINRRKKPASPSLSDSYSLLRYDKEKLAKDKARMHHNRQDDDVMKPIRRHSGKDRWHERDDGGFGQHQVSSLGSTPDIPLAVESDVKHAHKRFTYCSPAELSQSVKSTRSHHHPRSHRHRRMRDYDSDTGYRSDQELIKFRKQQQQMYQINSDNHSEIIPVSTSKGRKKDGYSSDLEAYSRRSANVSTYSDNSNTMKHSEANRTSMFSDSNYGMNPPQTNTVRNDEFYEHSVVIDNSVNHYPSPSPFQRQKLVDQSTPMSPVAGNPGFDPLSRVQVRTDGQTDRSDTFHTQEQMVDPQNKYMPTSTPNVGKEERPTPPYKSAPPYSVSANQRKLPPTPHRTSPYRAQTFDRNSPLKDYQRMPNIQEHSNSKLDLTQQRSRSQSDYFSGLDPAVNVKDSDHGNHGNYMDVNSFRSDSPRTSRYNSALERRSSIGHAQADVTSASSNDSGNYSYQHRVGESPVNLRISPLNSSQERYSNSRGSPFDYAHDPHRQSDQYGPSMYSEPPTVDIPSHYDDIAMFKNTEPASQVSSSTDSGYGYGHHPSDKVLGSSRFSGASHGSPSPDHFNSDSTSSHRDVNGQYSRGTTPTNNMHFQSQEQSARNKGLETFRVQITKNPGLGFSIAGGVGAYGNPFRSGDMGIFVTKVQEEGPAAAYLKRGDKLLEVNNVDFRQIEHNKAVDVLKHTSKIVHLYVERDPS